MSNQDKFVGVDLGGTHLRAAIVDSETGNLTGFKQISTQAHEGHEAVIVRMADLIHEVIELDGSSKEHIGGVGIGVPGVVDLERGWVKFVPNLPDNWREVPLSQAIENRVNLPTHLLNDARSMTFGEWKFGSGRGVQTMACFTLGTGIGGGLIVNGKLHMGTGDIAGELGHQTIDFNGPRCGCGNHGCVEAFASGPAIAAMGAKAVMQGLTTVIGELVNHDLNRITPKVIYQAAMEGDEVAHEIFELAGYYIGIAVGNVLVSVGPRKVVIGGGVSQAGDLLLDPICRTVRQRGSMVLVEQIQIVLAELGTNAGLVGAALWAKEQIQEKIQ